jgi:hypothetical protein
MAIVSAISWELAKLVGSASSLITKTCNLRPHLGIFCECSQFKEVI